MAKIIKSLPLNDRPYEKLELVGPSQLTNSELLAIVIKSGTKNLTCLDIARNILNSSKKLEMSDLDFLNKLSIAELKAFEGIGRVKAIEIKAVVELAKRIAKNYEKDLTKTKILSPADIFNLVSDSYAFEKQEILKTIILNKRNAVLSIVTNAIGSTDNINVSLKEILSEPIKQMASSIILTHNHPSGSLVPSNQDLIFTRKLAENSRIFNINLLDHIIIANNKYISLKNEKYF